MSPRFCSACGTRAVSGAKFCAECGSALGGRAAAAPAGWRPTAAGGAALGVFLAAGLATWVTILAPAPPRPGPGGGGTPRPPATAAAQLPEGHPAVPMELPAEVKTFIADLEAKTKEKPDDAEAWIRLAMVNSRAAQLDPSYHAAALAAFRHVLEIDPQNAEALRGIANVHYDRNEATQAIGYYERYLVLRPDDPSARTDLGTMYLFAGDAKRAIATYQDVLRRHPSFLQAHYNLAVTYHRQGDRRTALFHLETARSLATDEGVRKQIDEMLATLQGDGGTTRSRAEGDGAAGPSPFQAAVEQALRAHPIMGPRIVRVDWSGPAGGRVVVREFPMEGMPAEVRAKFTARLGEDLREAQRTHAVEGSVSLDIADLASGRVMATVTP
jgi:cytochrome c-type biogenesis protein CcmH/NrfG